MCGVSPNPIHGALGVDFDTLFAMGHDALGLSLGAQLRIGVLQLSVGLLRSLPQLSLYHHLLLRCLP